jgi:hypothetical protein
MLYSPLSLDPCPPAFFLNFFLRQGLTVTFTSAGLKSEIQLPPLPRQLELQVCATMPACCALLKGIFVSQGLILRCLPALIKR